MFPTFLVAVGHLWLKKASKDPITCPTNAITLLDAALNDDICVDDLMHVDPDGVLQYFVKLGVCINVLLTLFATELTPESFT